MNTDAPFDLIAEQYDDTFSESRLGHWLREAVWTHLDAAFQPGDHVLELACGTGEDAVHLAQRGVQVTATDASEGMLAVARRKVQQEDLGSRVNLRHFDMNGPEALPLDHDLQPFDGVFSNFGGLNCVDDLPALARKLARCTRPDASVVLVVMGPYCPWEWGWYLLHGRPRTAFRRLRSRVEAHVGAGRTLSVYYPSPARLAQAFHPGFRPVQTFGIGALLPPSYGSGLVDRHPAFFARLRTLEQRLHGRRPFTALNDHYLILLERR